MRLWEFIKGPDELKLKCQGREDFHEKWSEMIWREE
jgi:hypothetical protein